MFRFVTCFYDSITVRSAVPCDAFILLPESKSERSGVPSEAEEGVRIPLLSGERISGSDDFMHQRGSCHDLECATWLPMSVPYYMSRC